MLNQCTSSKMNEEAPDNLADDIIIESEISQQVLKLHKLYCVCSRSLKNSKLILCPGCQTVQHEKCVLKNCIGKKKEYKCPECWKSTEKVS